jgi:hypothetical protein
LPTPHKGQTQSSGTSSQAVPGAMPLSGSPASGSYTYPHTVHTHLSILLPPRLQILYIDYSIKRIIILD